MAPALLAVALALLCTASLVPLLGELRNTESTLEQLLPEVERARMDDARAPFGAGTEPLWVVLEGGWSEERVDALRGELTALPDVRRAERSEALETLAASPDLRLLRLELDPSTAGLEGARRLTTNCDAQLRAAQRTGERAYTAGLPRLRAESWSLARSEVLALLPLLAVLALGVPWFFLGSVGAGALALLLAACTTALTLWTYRLVSGPPSSLILLVLPLLWAVATLDALHFAGRVAHLARAGVASGARVARARAELLGPCLVTTLTTAAGFLTLGTLGPAGLLRGIGLASALGVVLAFVLTFTVGSLWIARLRPATPPRWPRRVALRAVSAARRSPRACVLTWSVLLLACVAAVPKLRFGGSFPEVFAPDVPIASDLEHLGRALDTDLAPVEVILRPETDSASRAPNLVSAVLVLTRELRKHAAVRAVLPLDLVPEFEAEGSVAGLDPSEREQQLTELLSHPELRPWVSTAQATARLEVHFVRGTSWKAKGEVLRDVERLDAGLIGHYGVVLAGPGYAAFRVEQLTARDLAGGGGLSLLVLALVLVLGIGFGGGGPRSAAAVLTSSLLPLLVLPAGMVLLDIPWSVALLPLPSLLLGLAVDDSVHLTWGARGRIRLGALPAILGTTVLIAVSALALTGSALSANQDLGRLLAGGLVVALAADLTLLPALARRSARAPRRRGSR